MAHTTTLAGYSRLVDRLNRFPQGAPPSETLYSILKMLFSEKEAELVSRLPLRPFTAQAASRVWKMSLGETRKILDELAERNNKREQGAKKQQKVENRRCHCYFVYNRTK